MGVDQRACHRCKKGKRGCSWPSPKAVTCTRCERMGVACERPLTEVPVWEEQKPSSTQQTRIAEKALSRLNLAPSNTISGLGQAHMSYSLMYDLVRSYQDYIIASTKLDPDLEEHRQEVLSYSGRISKMDDIDELRILVYMAAGARLSSHSVRVSPLPLTLTICSHDCSGAYRTTTLDDSQGSKGRAVTLPSRLPPRLRKTRCLAVSHR